MAIAITSAMSTTMATSTTTMPTTLMAWLSDFVHFRQIKLEK
jgi:hypothetical protein